MDKIKYVVDKDVMLKELSFQNNIFAEKDATKKAAMVAKLNKQLLASNELRVFVQLFCEIAIT